MSQEVEDALARIRRGDFASGVGFLAAEGRVLTCAHVVEAALGLQGTPTSAPVDELTLDFPLRHDSQTFRARVDPDCWVPIDLATGGGDIAGLDLLDPLPDAVRPLRPLSADDLYDHEFRTFGFPTGVGMTGIWAHGRILGRQALGQFQLEGTSDRGYFIEHGFSGSPIWDLELRGAIGMTVMADRATDRRTALCIAAADLLVAWPGLEPAAARAVADSALVTYSSVDGPWASWVSWWIERCGVPPVLRALDAGSDERLRTLGSAAQLVVAIVSPATDTAGAAAAVAGAAPVIAARVREGTAWPVAAAAAVDLVDLERSAAESALSQALATIGLVVEVGDLTGTPPPFPPDLARLRIDAGADEHRQQILSQNEQRRDAARNVAGRPPVDLAGLFVDRDEERARLRAGLAAHKLVTIAGRGGMGKTALACQVLSEIHEGDDSTAIVYLSTRTDELGLELIFRECASLLEADEREQLLKVDFVNKHLGLEAKVDRLLDMLGERAVIVLIDNAEDLLGPDGRLQDEGIAAFVQRTLASGGHGTRLLVTTREPIVLPPELRRFEQQIPLQSGLEVADGVAFLRNEDGDDRIGLQSAPEDKLGLVVERLHGVPRALQLLVSLAADDFRSVDRIAEGFFEEEQVVADLVEKAYSQLDDDSRTVLCVLSVFTRPVPAAAVAAVVEPLAPGLDVERVLRHLMRIDLVELDRTAATFLLHPIDREYARSLLGDTRLSEPALQVSAADYWARVRIPQEEWKDISDVEPHLLEIEHRLNAGDQRGAAEVLTLLDGVTARHAKVYKWDAPRLLALRERITDVRDDPELRMHHDFGLGQLYSVLGPTSQELERLDEALALARRLGNAKVAREALYRLSDTHRRMGDQGAAFDAAREAADLFHAAGEARGESHALSQMSLAESYRGHADEAVTLGEKALEVGDDPGSTAFARDALTLACYLGGRLEDALGHAEQALAFYDQAHDPGGAAYVVNEQGLIYLRLGRPSEAIEALERGHRLSEKIGSPRLAGLMLFNLAHGFLASGDAATACERALAAGDALRSAGDQGGAEGAEALAAAARARAAGDAATEAQNLAASARAVGSNPDLYLP